MGLFDTTQNTNVKPWGPTGDLLRKGYKDLWQQYKKGPTFYEGSTVTPFSDQTKSAFGGLSSLAGANSGGAGMSAPLQQMLNNGGFTQGQLDSMSSLRGMTQNPFMNSLINGNGLTQDQNSVADFYRNGMNEQFGTDANYNRVRQDALDSSAQGVNALAAKMGRFGGGANQNILARAQGSLAANMDTAELDKYRARTNAAAGNLANLSGTGVSQHGAAVDRKSGLESSLFNMGQAGIGNMNSAWNLLQQPYLAQRAVGAEYEDLFSRQKADELRKFDAANPMNYISNFLSTVNGAPKNQVTTTSQSPLQTGLGLGIGALGFGSLLNNWGNQNPAATGSYGTI